MLETCRPMDIEARSFEIITELLGDRKLDPENAPVIKRAIHTTADFDYADNLVFSPHAVQTGLEALRSGCDIVTDTQMAKAGINKTILASLGGEVHCFMSDPDVAAEAKSRGVTRAWVSMEKAAQLKKPCIFAIGNAPTALVSLDALMAAELLRPALLIGVPVGFVNVVESKELIIEGGRAPYIVARGRKGGSNVAAAICNALLYQIRRYQGGIHRQGRTKAPSRLDDRLLRRRGGKGRGLHAADRPGGPDGRPADAQGHRPDAAGFADDPRRGLRLLRHPQGQRRRPRRDA